MQISITPLEMHSFFRWCVCVCEQEAEDELINFLFVRNATKAHNSGFIIPDVTEI